MSKGRGVRRVLVGALLVAAVSAGAPAPSAGAQPPIEPIVTQTSRDGQVIGLKSNWQHGIWKPIAAIAYGLESKRVRYQAGLLLDTYFELPGLGVRVGPFSAAFVDWFSTPVLGREGQKGLRLGVRMGDTQYTGFFGELWSLPQEEHAPTVGYLLLEANRSFRLPYDLTLNSYSKTVFGVLLPAEGLEAPGGELAPEALPRFSSMTQGLTLRLGDLSLSGRWGSLENEAELPKFTFTTGVRGIPRALTGHVFWNVTLSREFPMYAAELPLPFPPELTEYGVPDSMPVSLDGKLFVQAGGIVREVEPEPESDSPDNPEPLGMDAEPARGDEGGATVETETEALFSWGISATLTVFEEFRVRMELIVNQMGETKFNVSF